MTVQTDAFHTNAGVLEPMAYDVVSESTSDDDLAIQKHLTHIRYETMRDEMGISPVIYAEAFEFEELEGVMDTEEGSVDEVPESMSPVV